MTRPQPTASAGDVERLGTIIESQAALLSTGSDQQDWFRAKEIAEAIATSDWLADVRREERERGVLGEVAAERVRQDAKWGEQNHANGTGEDWNWINGQGSGHIQMLADMKRETCERHFSNGTGSYSDILAEEVYEALAEEDSLRLREELIQVAAVAVAWVEKIDRDIVREARGGAR